MSAESYELLAYIARYWFAALALLVVIRAWKAAVRDNRKEQVLRVWEGGSGCVGEMVLLSDGSKRGKARQARFPVPQEAVIGSGPRSDIRLKGRGVSRRHIFMTYQKGQMVLHSVNGAPFETNRSDNGTPVLRDGDRLVVGPYKLMMVFFDTADAERSARKNVRPKQILPEDVSEDEFEDVWE